MLAEHDGAPDDEFLQQVIGELRRPVRLDPSVDRRALDRIRADFPGSPLLGYAALYGARAQFQSGDAAGACRWAAAR